VAKQKKLKIGWQKYEDLIEKQLSSPLIKIITNTLSPHAKDIEDEDGDNEELEEEDGDDYNQPLIFPFSSQFLEDVTMTANFECWVGHTNFDLTNKIKETLDRVDGIEILKICSRYRFFIGIGKMFSFAEVRQNIEKILLKENIDDKE
jgi:hypothetical protein